MKKKPYTGERKTLTGEKKPDPKTGGKKPGPAKKPGPVKSKPRPGFSPPLFGAGFFSAPLGFPARFRMKYFDISFLFGKFLKHAYFKDVETL